jgi:hypothetical protein
MDSLMDINQLKSCREFDKKIKVLKNIDGSPTDLNPLEILKELG